MSLRLSSLFLIFCFFIEPLTGNEIFRALEKKAEKAMEKNEWKSAEAHLETIINGSGCRVVKSIDLGKLHFNLGMCKFKQEKWQEATRSFERCYKKHPSQKGYVNHYHLLSLRYWAEAQYHLGNHKESSKLFMKHFRENPQS